MPWVPRLRGPARVGDVMHARALRFQSPPAWHSSLTPATRTDLPALAIVRSECIVAVEARVGLAIMPQIFRKRGTLNINELNLLKW